MRFERPGVTAQTNRFSAAVRKLLSIKGEEHDVNYGVHLEDERPEHSFVKGETLWVQTNEVTSAAGTLPIIGVLNPLTSGMLCVIQSAWAEVDAAALLVQIGITTNTGSGGGPMQVRDTRNRRVGGAAVGTTCLGFATTGAAPGFTGIYSQFTSLAAGQPIDMTAAGGRLPPVVLSPGWQIQIALSAVGVHVMRATFAGYERPLESGELQA